jgi:type IV pilus assembly protein PilV
MKATYTAALHARGFSLVEVMVAVVVICIGLLGIAKMQAMALSNTSMSRQRSLAAIEAASFASAMHADRVYWGNQAVDPNVSISGTTLAPVVQSADAVLQAQTIAALATYPNINACLGGANGLPVCNNTKSLAAYDLARWWAYAVSQQLPNPIVTVSCPPSPVGNPAPVSCMVQISWTEKAVAMNTNEAAAAQAAQANPLLKSLSEQPLFRLYVEP